MCAVCVVLQAKKDEALQYVEREVENMRQLFRGKEQQMQEQHAKEVCCLCLCCAVFVC